MNSISTVEPSMHAAPASLESRLSGLEAYSDQVSASIEQLVSVVLELKQQGAASPEVASLQQKVKELEQQLHIERSCRDLAQVSRMHPKTRSVVFVGTTYFGDNVKYAWLGVRDAARAQGIACWFLPFNAEQEAVVLGLGGDCLPHSYSQWTAEHLHLALSAGVLVTSDHFLNPNPFAAALLAGARHIQLWHGVSIKEIGLRNLPPGRALGPQMARVLATCGPYASLVGTAAAGEAEWRRWFAFQQYAPIGYPRNDVLYREPTEADLANVDRQAFDLATHTLARGKRVLLYAPTFRDANRGRWLLQAGLDKVAAALARQGDCLIVNLHPVEQPMAPQLAAELPGVTFVAPRTDIYPLLGCTSALITDYSSVMFDYLHLKRPLLLFRPDHEAYTERSRRLFDAKLSALPGPLLTHADALIHHLRSPQLGQTAAHRQVREQLLAQWFDHHDGHAAQRLLGLIGEQLAGLN
jgi:CDP-glycerol glycerophosphotransferase